jgi:hypothetical protein
VLSQPLVGLQPVSAKDVGDPVGLRHPCGRR